MLLNLSLLLNVQWINVCLLTKRMKLIKQSNHLQTHDEIEENVYSGLPMRDWKAKWS